jgi:hypothetical protein
MSSYQSTTPFIYAIGWTQHDRWYWGIRYAAGCSPSDLWTTYFTSSKYVRAFRDEYGEPDHIEVLFADTREIVEQAEADAILGWKLHVDERWLNRGACGKAFYCKGIPKSEEAKAHWSATKKGIPRPEEHRIKSAERLRASMSAAGANNPSATRNRTIPYNGKLYTMRELVKETGFAGMTIRRHMTNGLSVEEIVATVKHKKKRPTLQ